MAAGATHLAQCSIDPKKKIVFGLKGPSIAGFRCNFMIEIGKKCFNEL